MASSSHSGLTPQGASGPSFSMAASWPLVCHSQMALLRASIDTSAAKALPGVVDVWTADDIPEIGPIDFREGTIEKLAPYRQPVLAVGKVRYVGDPVAAVFAEDPYIAEDAADLVEVVIEELPPILDARDPLGEFSPGKQTEAAFLTQGYGDVDAVFKTAPHIVELKLTSGRHSEIGRAHV